MACMLCAPPASTLTQRPIMSCLLSGLFIFPLFFLIVTFNCRAQGAPMAIELTLVHGADAKGAVCLDGSLPGFHLDEGSGSGLNSWIVHLQGGAWCSDASSCALRAQTSLGSSHFMNASVFQGILSNSPRVNPYFYNWNRVKVRYCDGGSFSGDAELPMPARIPGTSQLQLLYYRGKRIWKAIMEDLLARGMNRTSQVYSDHRFRIWISCLLRHVKRTMKLRWSLVIAIFFPCTYRPDIKGNQFVQAYFRKVVTLQNIVNLPKGCTAERDLGQCFLAQHFLEDIYTPTFILQSAYDTYEVRNFLVPPSQDSNGDWALCKENPKLCSIEEIHVLQGFRKEMINALNPIQTFSTWGIYLISCFYHTLSQQDYLWNGASQIASTSVVDAVGRWFYKGIGTKYVDCPYPLQQRRKYWHDTKIKVREFKQGDLVLLYQSRLGPKKPNLKIAWSGPYEVDWVFSNGTVRLKDLFGLILLGVYNGAKIKLYYFAPTGTGNGEGNPVLDDDSAAELAPIDGELVSLGKCTY
ncbi:hypothetical protein L7F22_041888 [Adiantum nelumboides]|nr:hypothetical protein [Adiantum nelumboides]